MTSIIFQTFLYFKNLAFFIILTICNKIKSYKISILLKVKLTFFLYEEFLSTIMYILKCLVLFSFYVSNLHHRLSYSLKIDLNIGINVPITSIAHRYWSKSWKLTIINSNNSLIYFCIIMISFITMKVY
jgi:hypothetical protein